MTTACKTLQQSLRVLPVLVLVSLPCLLTAGEPGAQAVNFGGDEIGGFQADEAIREDNAMRWVSDEAIDLTGIVNPAPSQVYEDGLTGRISHTFKSLIARQTYVVRIHYAEVFSTGPRERMSNVYINESPVRSGYDVFGATGAAYTATVQEYTVAADGTGRINLAFLPIDRLGDGVCVAGVEVIPYRPPGPQPSGWWRFDEVGGTAAKDAIGPRTGVVVGAKWDVGQLGGALVFDGSNDYVRIDGAAPLLTESFSIACWVTGTTPGRVIASVQGGPILLMASQTNGYLTSDLAGPGLISSEPSITDSVWHHILVTFDKDATQVSLYVDGLQITREMGLLPPAFTDRLHIGAGGSLPSNSFWQGSIDDMRIYDHALSDEEITSLLEQSRRTQTAKYYSNSKVTTMRVRIAPVATAMIAPLSFRLDGQAAIGAVAGQDATEKEIRDFAREAGFTDIRIQEPENLVLLDLPDPCDRAGLVLRARQIRSMLEEPSVRRIFQEIGMVVRPGEATAPMLALDSFIVQFRPSASQANIDRMNGEPNYVEVVWRSPYVSNLFLLAVTDRSPCDAIDMANRYYASRLTEYAVPNFAAPIDLRQDLPNDKLFTDQWHLHNTGRNGETVDADIDAPQAWDITTGCGSDGRKVVIAVIDAGFDVSHPDLKENLWVNAEESQGSPGVDDDDNGYVDDIHGWDFGMNTNTPPVHVHGTAAAGCAGARRNNGIGVTGSCPDCSLMLLSYGTTNITKAQAIDYAWMNGADVISISWGYFSDTTDFPDMIAALKRAANEGRNGLGCAVLLAMTNPSRDNGSSPYDIAALEDVIAVSRTTDSDESNPGGYGRCMDILGPTHGGSRSIATTDVQGDGGYNINGTTTLSNCPPKPGEADDTDYTLCFSGTSAACPIVAGVAGLVLSVAPDLKRLQVQRLLQDTADKVQPSTANYSTINGFSNWPLGAATHGYGRVNAFEAVRVAGPRDKGGRGGVDIFMRDNGLDWGNTEQPSHTLFESTRGFIPYRESPDIRIDVSPYQTSQPDVIAFDDVVDEVPQAGKLNRIFIRVRNRGPRPSDAATVKLYWCYAEPNQEPDLPADFWARYPETSTDTTHWKPVGAKTTRSAIPYSGSSVAGTGSDLAQFVYFTLDLRQQPPGPCCLLAIADSPQDPVSSETKSRVKISEITPCDNNVTQRNVVILPPPN